MKRVFLLAAAALYAATSLSLASEARIPGFFFDQAPFVHPKIIEDLSTRMSDTGEQVVAVNLVESAHTNRYFGDVAVSGQGLPFIYYEAGEACKEEGACPNGPAFFGYRLVGVTRSGVNVLITEWSGGGSGRFRSLLLVKIEFERGLTNYSQGIKVLRFDRGRWLAKRVGEIILGDRYEGDVAVKGDSIYIGKDEYSSSAGFFPEDVVIEVIGK